MSFYKLLLLVIIWCFLSFSAFGGSNPTPQKENLQIAYTVAVTNPETKMFHVVTIIKNIRQPNLDLSLPVWSPGWYSIENYGKNLLRFKITDSRGNVLPHTMPRRQTWRVSTGGIDEIKVEYDYHADILALNQAKITKEFAFFTGTELFLQPEGYRQTPSTVHFVIPQNWKLISALKETSDPMTYAADNYDVLVDAPTEMGNFDVLKFEVENKPHYLVTTPAGAFSAERSKQFSDMLTKVASAESKIFGGLPYEKYVYFYFFDPPESNASGALEHLNSFAAFVPDVNAAEPENLIITAAHEIFHLWNVKRIRPAEMFPYDYSRENETSLLWVSEGFTDYYADLAVYRAGLMTEKDLLELNRRIIRRIENNEARQYISPAESSVSTWAGYDTPVAFGISYYMQGQNLGALLDLSIRNDTGGRASLDDVMRILFKDYYKRGRGFTTEDMISVINSLTKKDYHEFYRRYVFGVEVPDYKTIYGYAGYKVETKHRQTPELGFGRRDRDGGLYIFSIEPNSPGAKAGLQVGDVITKINGEDYFRAAFDPFVNKAMPLTIRRNGLEREIIVNVGALEETDYIISDLPQPTEKQLEVRRGWLNR